MAYLVLKNGGFLPEHLQWRKELETCRRELEQRWEHCRQRLGGLLARWRAATANSVEPSRQKRPASALRFWKSWELNPALRRGKRVDSAAAAPARQLRHAQHLYRAYLDDRFWLRQQVCDLANRAGEIAQRLHEALVDKEIRDQRPVVFLLGSPHFSAKDLLAQFDREFPALPLEAMPAEHDHNAA